MTVSVYRCFKRKTMSVWVKEYINENCNLQKFYRKTPKCKYWVLKVLYLETQMVCSGWLKSDSLCLRMKRSSKCCAACWCNWRKLCLALSIFIKNYLPSFLYHHHSQEHFFFNCSITVFITVLIFSQWFPCSMLLLVIFGSFNSKEFSHSKIFYLFLILIAK